MRGETQSVHLAKIMQKHKIYPEYELVLPLLLLKRSSLKKLSKGDVLLLGENHFNLKLFKEGEYFGNVELEESENSRKLIIRGIDKHTISSYNSKKYEKLKCSFCFIQSRVFEVGHKIDISSVNLKRINLILDTKKVAEGSLVNVDEEIAIEITKVNV